MGKTFVSLFFFFISLGPGGQLMIFFFFLNSYVDHFEFLVTDAPGYVLLSSSCLLVDLLFS